MAAGIANPIAPKAPVQKDSLIGLHAKSEVEPLDTGPRTARNNQFAIGQFVGEDVGEHIGADEVPQAAVLGKHHRITLDPLAAAIAPGADVERRQRGELAPDGIEELLVHRQPRAARPSGQVCELRPRRYRRRLFERAGRAGSA